MVDQAQVKSTNGSAESPPRAVARSATEFIHDVLTLAELQGKLLVVDFRSGVRKLLWPTIGLAVGCVLALCCVPLALAALALAIAESTTLTHSQALGLVLAGAILAAAILVAGAALYLRHSWTIFDRSRTELTRNVQWSKEMLRKLGRDAPRRATTFVASTRSHN
ncbi:MAG TPA: phage holin family protein [Pirellulaceae bacterium]|nr:phage holin family protein [Pirellulaceae bacterium]